MDNPDNYENVRNMDDGQTTDISIDVRVVRPVCLSRCVSEEEGPPRSPTPAERDTNQAFISHSPSPPRAKNSRYYICWSRHKPRVYWHFWHYVAYMSRLEVRKRIEIWMVRQAVQ